MDVDEISSFRAAIRDITTLIELTNCLEGNERQTVVAAVKRKLLDLPSIRHKDHFVTRSDVLRDLVELKVLLGEYNYDEWKDLESMVAEEAEALMAEQHGAETFVLAAPKKRSMSESVSFEKVPIQSISVGYNSIEADGESDYSLNFCFDAENVGFSVVDSQAQLHSEHFLKIDRFIQVVHADNKIAFVPVPNKGYKAICIEMPTSDEVRALLRQLAKVATWYHE